MTASPSTRNGAPPANVSAKCEPVATSVLTLAAESGVANAGCSRQSEELFVPAPAGFHAEAGDEGLLGFHQRLECPGLSESRNEGLLGGEGRARVAPGCGCLGRRLVNLDLGSLRCAVERILIAEEQAQRIPEAGVRRVERPGAKHRVHLAPTEDLLPVELVFAEVVKDDDAFQLLRVLLGRHRVIGKVEAQRESDRRQRHPRGRESKGDLARVIGVGKTLGDGRARLEVERSEPIEVLACEQHEAVVQVEGARLFLRGYGGRHERVAVLYAQRLVEEPFCNSVPRLPIADSGRRRKAVVPCDPGNCRPLEHEIENRLEVRDRQHVCVGAHEDVRVDRRRPVQLVDLPFVGTVREPLAGEDHGHVREVGEPAGKLEARVQPWTTT